MLLKEIDRALSRTTDICKSVAVGMGRRAGCHITKIFHETEYSSFWL